MLIAHCEPKSLEATTTWSTSKCSPINQDVCSTSVDVPDPDAGMDCVPVSGKPVWCGDRDTRCVCDALLDATGIQSNKVARPYFLNSCRCQPLAEQTFVTLNQQYADNMIMEEE